MSKIDNNPMSESENSLCARVLRDDELDAVSGAYSWGVSQLGTVVSVGFFRPNSSGDGTT